MVPQVKTLYSYQGHGLEVKKVELELLGVQKTNLNEVAKINTTLSSGQLVHQVHVAPELRRVSCLSIVSGLRGVAVNEQHLQ